MQNFKRQQKLVDYWRTPISFLFYKHLTSEQRLNFCIETFDLNIFEASVRYHERPSTLSIKDILQAFEFQKSDIEDIYLLLAVVWHFSILSIKPNFEDKSLSIVGKLLGIPEGLINSFRNQNTSVDLGSVIYNRLLVWIIRKLELNLDSRVANSCCSVAFILDYDEIKKINNLAEGTQEKEFEELMQLIPNVRIRRILGGK